MVVAARRLLLSVTASMRRARVSMSGRNARAKTKLRVRVLQPPFCVALAAAGSSPMCLDPYSTIFREQYHCAILRQAGHVQAILAKPPVSLAQPLTVVLQAPALYARASKAPIGMDTNQRRAVQCRPKGYADTILQNVVLYEPEVT